MKNMDQNSSVYKMMILGILCAVCGLLLSAVNAVTAPIIEENNLAVIKSSLEEIYPGGDFADVTSDYISMDETGLVDGIYEAKGQGYIFTLHGTGYNSNGFTFMVGFDNDGKVSGFREIEQNETDRQLVRTMIDQASIFNVKVCVEGIETAGMRDILQQFNVESFQGYYYAKPLELTKFVEWDRS